MILQEMLAYLRILNMSIYTIDSQAQSTHWLLSFWPILHLLYLSFVGDSSACKWKSFSSRQSAQSSPEELLGIGCSVLPQCWNFASLLGEPMRIGMIGPQTKIKIHRPIFVFNWNFNGKMDHACLKMDNFPQNGHFQACRQWSPRVAKVQGGPPGWFR